MVVSKPGRDGQLCDSSAVDLSAYFLEIAATYDRRDGLVTNTQAMLTGAPELMAEHTPAGLVVQGSGGKGVATLTPWVGFFDPDETDSPQRGVYVVYIFSEDMEVLALTLNQGMEELRRQLGDARARDRLRVDADAIRAAVPARSRQTFADPIDLRSTGSRQRAYEAGNIACQTYEVGTLPSESQMRDDLAAMLALYADAVHAKRRLLLTSPGAVASPSAVRRRTNDNVLAQFRPKNDSDYVAHLQGRVINKSRRHETIVSQYGRIAGERGFIPTTEHPQDLVLRRDGITYVVEVKVVYNGNATDAVRAALGQLLGYKHFLYAPAAPPRLVALFSEPVGDAYVAFLEAHKVASIWWQDQSWRGSPVAREWQLAAM